MENYNLKKVVILFSILVSSLFVQAQQKVIDKKMEGYLSPFIQEKELIILFDDKLNFPQVALEGRVNAVAVRPTYTEVYQGEYRLEFKYGNNIKNYIYTLLTLKKAQIIKLADGNIYLKKI